MADDFTMTLLRTIQLERTTPEGGWLDAQRITATMGLTSHEAEHLRAPLQELFEAGMIEKRFNARRGRDEWRSVGTLPSLTREPLEATAAREDDAVVEEHMARRLMNFLLTTPRGEWYRDGALCKAVGTHELGAVWDGLNLLEAAGLIERRPDHRAIRLHTDLKRWA